MHSPTTLKSPHSNSLYRIKTKHQLLHSRFPSSKIIKSRIKLNQFSNSLIQDSPKRIPLLNFSTTIQSLEQLQTQRINNILEKAKKRIKTVIEGNNLPQKTIRKKSPEEEKLLEEWGVKVYKKRWGDNLGEALFEQEKIAKMKGELKKRKLPEISMLTERQLKHLSEQQRLN